MSERAVKTKTMDDDDVDVLPPDDKRNNLVPFKKGDKRQKGRPAGRTNRITRVIKEAVLLGGEQCGEPFEQTYIDKKTKKEKTRIVWNGRDGLVGYMRYLAKKQPGVYGQLLAKIIPMQVTHRKVDDDDEYESAEDVGALLRAQGMNVKLIDKLTSGVFMQKIEHNKGKRK